MKADDRIYLASPYSHADPAVERRRFMQATSAAARLCGMGHVVYSPIAHGRVLAEAADLPGDWRFWERQCVSFMRHWATHLAVLKLGGWQESRGIRAELAEAEALGIPVSLLDPATLEEEPLNAPAEQEEEPPACGRRGFHG